MPTHGTHHANAPRPSGWSADGRLVFDQSLGDIGVVSLEDDRTSELLLDDEFVEADPAISPDGRWIAYDSLESGRFETYVRPFPNVGDGKWQVSVDGGFDPVWSSDGRELFMNSPTGMMVMQVETVPTFEAGRLERLPYRPGFPVQGTEFDVAPEGDRLVFLGSQGEVTEAEGLIFVENWFEELKERVPVP